MITPAIYELRHLAATARFTPAVASLIKPGGNIGNTTAKEASDFIDQQIMNTDDVHAGPWIMGTPGKGFCICNEITLDSPDDIRGASNFGWIAPASEVSQSGGAYWWKGIEVYACLVIPGYFYIQRHTDLGHGLYQDDYASQPLFVRADAIANGSPTTIDRLYQDPKLCALVTHDGVPLKWVRHPGVTLEAEITTSPPPADTTILPPDTVPSGPAWLDPDLSHGDRKVLWLEEQRAAGVCEKPNHSNNGPEISTYHAATKRDGQPGYGKWLASAGGNWCASSAWAAHMLTRIEGDPEPVGVPRSSGLETETDAKKDGTWRPAELATTGKFTPEAGDIATMQRGTPGSWRRHVVTVVRDVPERRGVITLGGNEGNRFGPDTFRKYSALLGFRELADDAGPRFEGDVPYQGEDVAIEMPPLVVTPGATNPLADDGDNALALDGWDHMDPDPWNPAEWRGVRGHSRRWRTTAKGIAVQGEPGPRRTKGEPITMGKRWAEYGAEVREAHEETGIPIATILATIQTESGGKADAERFEAHLNDWSFGLAQTLTETAWAIARQLDVDAPRKPIPRGGVASEWRAFLSVPRNSILIGAAYLAYNDERFRLLGDPILAAASYNAGSPRVKLENPWGIVCTTAPTYDHCDVFSRWWGDALAVI